MWYGEQLASITAWPSARTRSRRSAARRDFPMPAGPRMTPATRSGGCPRRAASSRSFQARCSSPLCSTRPTSGTACRCPGSGREPAWLGRSTWNTSTGRENPVRERIPRDTRSKWASTRCFVALLITTVPGSACDCRRAVRLAAAPTMSEASTAPDANPVTTTVPEWTPTRISVSMPYRRRNSVRPSAIRSTSPRPAMTARRASSSWTFGYPKHATTPSPWNWRIRPSRSCMASVAASR